MSQLAAVPACLRRTLRGGPFVCCVARVVPWWLAGPLPAAPCVRYTDFVQCSKALLLLASGLARPLFPHNLATAVGQQPSHRIKSTSRRTSSRTVQGGMDTATTISCGCRHGKLDEQLEADRCSADISSQPPCRGSMPYAHTDDSTTAAQEQAHSDCPCMGRLAAVYASVLGMSCWQRHECKVALTCRRTESQPSRGVGPCNDVQACCATPAMTLYAAAQHAAGTWQH